VTSPSHDAPEKADRPDEEPPKDISKPIGDAIPTPVEPGLDQPLPEKKPDDDVNAGKDGKANP
jgi:hypothetical protein